MTNESANDPKKLKEVHIDIFDIKLIGFCTRTIMKRSKGVLPGLQLFHSARPLAKALFFALGHFNIDDFELLMLTAVFHVAGFT